MLLLFSLLLQANTRNDLPDSCTFIHSICQAAILCALLSFFPLLFSFSFFSPSIFLVSTNTYIHAYIHIYLHIHMHRHIKCGWHRNRDVVRVFYMAVYGSNNIFQLSCCCLIWRPLLSGPPIWFKIHDGGVCWDVVYQLYFTCGLKWRWQTKDKFTLKVKNFKNQTKL